MMFEIGGNYLRQSNETLYLAVYYLDWIMNDYEILEPNYNLFAISCLFIACKVAFIQIAKQDELDLNIPHSS